MFGMRICLMGGGLSLEVKSNSKADARYFMDIFFYNRNGWLCCGGNSTTMGIH